MQDTAETEGQTTAGGLGEVEKRPLDYQGLSLTERWDANIGRTAEKVRFFDTCLSCLLGQSSFSDSFSVCVSDSGCVTGRDHRQPHQAAQPARARGRAANERDAGLIREQSEGEKT